MTEAFLKIVNMSISAGWLVMAVLVLRLVLKKAPKWILVLMWGIVAVRLICPFSIESALSLIPSAETISPEIMMDRTPEISTGIESLDRVVNPVISTSFAPEPIASANPLQILIPMAANLWLLGVLVMLAYALFSYLRLKKRVSTAFSIGKNIRQSEYVDSPFVLGLFRPVIYLPFRLDSADMEPVIAHELTHIRRKDHWWKPLGYTLLAVHWFNPLMWVAYILLCRDIELACDEKVIAQLGNEQRADYSRALVVCSVKRYQVAACPLAFGEVGVKERVKSILNYRKPAFWVIVTAMVLCAVVAVCFLTDPNPSRGFAMDGKNVADLDAWKIVDTIADLEGLDDGYALNINPMNFNLQLTGDFEWDDSQAIRFFYTKDLQEYSAQLRIFPEEGNFYVTAVETRLYEQLQYKFYSYLQALKYMPQDSIRALCPDADGYIITQRAGGSPDDYERVITYTADGTHAIDGWLIHFELQPMHNAGDGMHGMGEEVIHLFYRDSGGDCVLDDQEKPVTMEPTQTNLRGLVAGYLFTPINGATYRYALTDADPAGVTADKLLDTCTEETPIESIVWEVYSLKEYPDMTKLLIISGTNSAWLCEYAPARQTEEGALQAVKDAGYVVEEDGWLTSGREEMEAFYQATRNGTPAFLQVAHYYTLDPGRTAPDTYEAYKQDYPALYIHELSFDGEVFVLRTQEDVRVYEYLMKYSVSGTPLAVSGNHEIIDRYVLTHDNTHTWDQLWSSLLSSAAGVAIDHYTVCSVKN